MSNPFTPRDLVLERRNFRDQVKPHLQCRMPPGREADPYVEKAVRKYRPPNRAADRNRVFEAALIASRRLIVPEWRSAYSDRARNSAALEQLLERFRALYPLSFAVVVDEGPDEQWIYLLMRLQKFDSESTAKITRFRKSKVNRLCARVEAKVKAKSRAQAPRRSTEPGAEGTVR